MKAGMFFSLHSVTSYSSSKQSPVNTEIPTNICTFAVHISQCQQFMADVSNRRFSSIYCSNIPTEIPSLMRTVNCLFYWLPAVAAVMFQYRHTGRRLTE